MMNDPNEHLEQSQEVYSHMYKEAYGIRPRIDGVHLTVEQWNDAKWLDDQTVSLGWKKVEDMGPSY